LVYEDFTTYTEVDPNSHIGLVGTDHVDFKAYSNEEALLYLDKDAGFFTDFEHLIDVKMNDHSGDNCPSMVWLLSNDVDSYYGLHLASKHHIGIEAYWYEAWGAYRFRVWESYGGTPYVDTSIDMTKGTMYYFDIIKDGTSLTVAIYNDSARTSLKDTISLTMHADINFQYIFVCNSWDAAANKWIDVDIENLDLQEAVALKPSSSSIVPIMEGIGMLQTKRKFILKPFTSRMPKFSPRIVI